MGTVVVCDHPLIQHKLAHIRDERTCTKEFRELVEEVAALMAYEITKNLPLKEVTVKTPVAETAAKVIDGRMPVLVPLLRAGLGMAGAVLKLLPNAKVGHIGLFRDEASLKPVEYYVNLPADAAEREVIVIDPMLATGGSAAAAVQTLKARGCRRIKLMCLIAAPEGVSAMRAAHPDVDIYTAAIDERLDERGFIVPGLGDAGDRLFGTD